MRSYIKFFAFTILCFPLFLISCTKETDSKTKPEETIIGTWEYKYQNGLNSFLRRPTFNADNSGNEYYSETSGSNSDSGNYDFTWSLQGSHLTLIHKDDGDRDESNFTISGNTLTLTYDSGNKYVFSRK